MDHRVVIHFDSFSVSTAAVNIFLNNKWLMYEAYVRSKFRYKIYLAMNDVTSMLYVSLVRQFEPLLFYVVTSRIEALVVSRHKFLNACVEKVYRLLL